MPTKTRRKPVEKMIPEFSQPDLNFLLSGRVDVHSDGGFDTFIGIAHPRKLELARELWRRVGSDVLKAWGRLYPGRRPWAWWRWDAPGPREVIGPVPQEDPLTSWHEWREAFGLPVYPGTAHGLRIESDAAYLRRLGLLNPRELKVLKAADFEPVTLDGELHVGATETFVEGKAAKPGGAGP